MNVLLPVSQRVKINWALGSAFVFANMGLPWPIMDELQPQTIVLIRPKLNIILMIRSNLF